MVFGNFSVSYPADEHYPPNGFEQALGNATQLIHGRRSLVNFMAINTSANVVWLAAWDDKTGIVPLGAKYDANGNYLVRGPIAEGGWNWVITQGSNDLTPAPGIVAANFANLALTGLPNTFVTLTVVKQNADGPNVLGENRLLELIPIAGPGWYQSSVHGGTDLINGLWVGTYSTAALAIAAGVPDVGAVMYYRADYNAPKVLPLT